jgi:triphosphoribosyl-dephospho-CoA synthetase
MFIDQPFREVRGTLKTQNENFATAIGALAALASLVELATTPKPGLVDFHSQGAHGDMDWTLFVLSASALAPYWQDQVMEGMKHRETEPYRDLYAKLKARGLEMEYAMFEATGGVNTHKGLIFSLSLLTGASGVCLNEDDCSAKHICLRSSEIASPHMAEEFERIRVRGADKESGDSLSNGEKIFLEHGIGGIRKEAMKGFPSLLHGLAVYEDAVADGASGNDAALSALLGIMSVCEDTNVINRAGVDFWRGEYMERVKDAKKKFDPLNPSNYEPLIELDKLLVERGVSPGGAADLLACTLFLYRSKMSDNNQ